MINGYEYSDGGNTAIHPPERVIHIRTSWDYGSSGSCTDLELSKH
ncbi:MAG: hypothetical protein CM15mV149_080 [uncultured marine virus]|nr:MAG: hypothetical protein CM15mV149_080 [uncultured marine virus]